MTFYARRNVSQSVTIRDLRQKCHTSKIIGENREVLCIYMVSTFMGERLLLKKELREVCWTGMDKVASEEVLSTFTSAF